MGAAASTAVSRPAETLQSKLVAWVKKRPAALVLVVLVLALFTKKLKSGKAKRIGKSQQAGPFRVEGAGTEWANGLYTLDQPQMFGAPKYRQTNADGTKGTCYIYRLRGGGEWRIVDRPGWAVSDPSPPCFSVPQHGASILPATCIVGLLCRTVVCA